jgi:hypothetical protein
MMVYHAAWYTNGWFIVFFIILLIVGFITTLFFDDTQTGAQAAMPRFIPLSIFALCVLNIIVGIFYFYSEPARQSNWYKNEGLPYINELPQVRADDIALKPLYRYEDNTISADVGFPDQYGFLVNETITGKLVRDSSITKPAMTYKNVETRLGRKLPKGRYDVTFLLPAAQYDTLSKNQDFETKPGVLKLNFSRDSFIEGIFWFSVFLSLILLFAAIYVYYNTKEIFGRPAPTPPAPPQNTETIPPEITDSLPSKRKIT